MEVDQQTPVDADALDSLLLPIGGFKGSGLAVIMGIFSSMLSGAAYGTELGSKETGARAGQDGHFVAVLHIGAFVDVAEFKERVDAAIRQIHDCRPAPGIERIYAPGELKWRTRKASRHDGFPLNAPTRSGLQEAARRVGLELWRLERPGGGR